MLTVEMARCIAKISGDGCLYYRYIRYNNTCQELREEFIADVKKEFNHFKFTYGKSNSGTPFVQIHGKALIGKFLEFLPSYKSEDIYVPSQIFEASEEVKCAYLRALFDDEGSVGIRIFEKTGEWKRNVKIDSKSRKLLEGIKFLLQTIGVSSNEIRMCTKQDKFWYYLGISGRANFSLFASKIGFTHPLKQQKLVFLLRTYKMTYRRNYVSFIVLQEELKKLLKPHNAAQ